MTKKTVAKPYEPTPYERARARTYITDMKENPPAPMVKVSTKGGVVRVELDHPEPAVGNVLLMDALGTKDEAFLNGIIGQLVNAGTQGKDVDERGVNFMLSLVEGVHPKDQVETMLAAQMAAVHMATMTFARRLAHVDNIPQQDIAERAFNKLCRTFAAQVQALQKYRTGGEQKVTVEHVHVNSGGQAIVGNVTTGGGGAEKKGGTTPCNGLTPSKLLRAVRPPRNGRASLAKPRRSGAGQSVVSTVRVGAGRRASATACTSTGNIRRRPWWSGSSSMT